MKTLSPDNLGYNKRLKPLAGKLRKQMTKSESCMWKFILKAGQMKGYQFNRQRPVLDYIADFMSKELMLIIELDGVTHGDSDTMLKDVKRQRVLEEAGFTVLRFTDTEMLQNRHGVYCKIENWISEYEKTHPEVKPSRRYE